MISRLVGTARLLLPALAGIAAVSANAQANLPPEVKISWQIVAAVEPQLAFDIAKNKPYSVATAQPLGLLALEQPAVRAKGSSAIPAGALFAPSIIGTGVICEPGRRPGQDTISCLADSDSDGRFDHSSKVQTRFIEWDSMTKIGFLVDVNPVSPWQPLGSPVTAAPVAEVPATAKMNIELTLTWPKSGRGTRFNLCAMKNEGKDVWGGNIMTPFCAPELTFPGGRGQQQLANLPGGSLTLVSIGKSSARILLDPPKVGTTY
ncbi:MAG: hypothetical protein NBV68_02620 [Erythrobacter sp.]|uniref:hypothetical protein n=1 Tax=Erythrobacter sp. TaxID=1042 RepID=UPI0025F36B11|nr:hypothetical protein [Erythrobacter sp.]MCL9998251.1 hypothetical protein [Erythrobacter sp.]